MADVKFTDNSDKFIQTLREQMHGIEELADPNLQRSLNHSRENMDDSKDNYIDDLIVDDFCANVAKEIQSVKTNDDSLHERGKQ